MQVGEHDVLVEVDEVLAFCVRKDRIRVARRLLFPRHCRRLFRCKTQKAGCFASGPLPVEQPAPEVVHAVDPSGRKYSRRKQVRHELLDLLGIAHLGAGLVEKARSGCVADAHCDAVAGDRPACHPDRRHAAASVCLLDERPGAQVDDGGDFDAARREIARCVIGVGVRGEHHDAGERLHRVSVDQPLRR